MFIEALGTYFSKVLVLTNYAAFALISIGFLIYTLPKDLKGIGKKFIVFNIIKFVSTYVICLIVNALTFGLSNVSGVEIFFNLSLPVVVGVAAAIFSKGNFIHRFIKTLILFAAGLVIEVLSKTSGYLIGLPVGTNEHILVYIVRTIPYFIFPVFAYLFYKVDIARYKHLSAEMITIVSLLSSFLILVAIFEHVKYYEDVLVNVLLMISDMFLLFISMFSYYATYKIIENRHRITNLEVQKTLEDAERMSLDIDRNNREEMAKLRHDIKNQSTYLAILIQQGKNEEALKYINDYLAASGDVLNSFSCSNNVINSIINLELTKAKIKNVKMDVKVVVPPMLPFKDNDLVSLLTNMIDNALENYKSESNEEITIQIFKQNDFIRFLVSNPTDVKKLSRGNLTTTRKTGRGHGYGTKIIRNIAKEYNGYVQFGVEGNRFVCDAVLDVNQKEQ